MTLKRIHLRVAALLVATLVGGACVLNARQTTKSREESPVHATIDVISQGYCLNSYQDRKDDRFGYVAFVLHLRIENASDRPVILCRECVHVAEEPTLLVMRTEGTPGQVRNGGMSMDNFGFESPRQDLKSPNQSYTILKPHETFDGNYKTGILVSYNSPTTPRYNLSSGSYLLRIEFSSWWVERADTSKSLREKWQAYGDLYSDPLRPSLVPVRIEVPERLSPCPVNK